MRKGILGRMRNGIGTLGAALFCILIGLAVGFVCLIALSWSALASKGAAYTVADVLSQAYHQGFKFILMGGYYLPRRKMPSELALAAPLIMCGLSVGFAFKTGLFNIGAAGQYTVGAFGALYCAIALKCPWYVCLLGAALLGALWGAIPGFFKAYFNINEVITAIMFNWIGLYGVNTFAYGGGTSPLYCAQTTKTWALTAKNVSAIIPSLSKTSIYLKNPATIGIFLAVGVAVLLTVILNKTTFGYELKACGFSKSAARYAGIDEKKNIILSMTIAGALAGFGAGLYYLSGIAEWQPLVSTALPGMGFDGISVALLASSNPIGIIFSALFISHISTGGGSMNASVFPPEIADVISGIIIYLCAFMMLFKGRILKLISGKRAERGQ